MQENYEDFGMYFDELDKWRDQLQVWYRGRAYPTDKYLESLGYKEQDYSFSSLFFAFLKSQSTKRRDAAYALVSLAARLFQPWYPKNLAINYQKPDYFVFWDLVFELDDGFSSISAKRGRLSGLRDRIVGPASTEWWENAHSELELYRLDDTTPAAYKMQAELALWTMKKISALKRYFLEPLDRRLRISTDRAHVGPAFRLQAAAVELVQSEKRFHNCPSTAQDFFGAWRCSLHKAKDVLGARQGVTETSYTIDTDVKPYRDEDQSSSHCSESRFNCLHTNRYLDRCRGLVLDIPEAQVCLTIWFDLLCIKKL